MPYATPPDPTRAGTLDELLDRLRSLKAWAGNPSYETIKDRVNAAWTEAGRPPAELVSKSTVAYCFRPGRRRVDTDLLITVVRALHPDPGYLNQWRQTLRVINGETEAESQVRVQDRLPRDLPGFTGRTHELDRLRHTLDQATRSGRTVLISAIEGMAGVGKTQLAIHAGHQLHREHPFDRILFVNLRGFDADPTRPPADPAAVLDGFLRLLGMPGQQIPHDLDARATAYRRHLTGARTLVVLDNAATEKQVRPLLPTTPGCLTLVTSRRRLTGLHRATHLPVDVFHPDEARDFLTHATAGTPTGADPHATARIAHRCGHLPLALSLLAGHIRATPGWTLTDHADRLDERHHQRRLDTGVELALHLSYQHLPADQRRLLRLLALHPRQDFDAYAAAALTATDLTTTREHLTHLCRDHLLQHATDGRHTFHDLVRAYAAGRAHDEDRPADRHAALTRLFDHYLATTVRATNLLDPADARLRPTITPSELPAPDLPDLASARRWLDTERPALVSVTAHTATHGWPTHTTGLARSLFRYLNGGHLNDAVTVHTHACHAARDLGDPARHAHALTDLGIAYLRLARIEEAVDRFHTALDLFRQAADPAGEARVLNSLAFVEEGSGRYQAAEDHFRRALDLYRHAGDRAGEANVLSGLGIVMERTARLDEAVDCNRQALTIYQADGDTSGEAIVLNTLGEIEVRAGRLTDAGDHLRRALALHAQIGNHGREADVLDGLGQLHVRLGQPHEATTYFQQALTIYRECGDRTGQAWALNGLGEADHTAGQPTGALSHHTDALTIAVELGACRQQARAHTGIGHAHRALDDLRQARHHYEQAQRLYTKLELPEADHLRATLDTLTPGQPDVA
jgi:tetratricopeptide (TPR) repeat protein